jgi:hypothetical protein
MTQYVPFNRVPIQQRPWGPAAGVDASIMDDQAQKAEALSLQSMLTQNQQSQANLDRYSAQTPNEIDKSNLEGLLARSKGQMPGYGNAMAQGDMGDAQSRYAKGQFDVGTLGGRMDVENSGNVVKAFELAGRHLELTAASNPAYADAEYKRFLGLVPEKVRGAFPQDYSPAVPQILKHLTTALTNTPAHRGAMELEGKKGETNTNIQTNHDTNAYNIALLRTEAYQDMIAARWGMQKDDVKKIEHMVTQYLLKKARGQATTPEEDESFKAGQQIMHNMRAAAAGMDPTAWRNNIFQGGNGGPSGPRETPKPVVVADPKMRAAVEGAGEKYDPENYDYRINGSFVEKHRRGR